ncbi:unnamed protein product, partial [Musa acuminata var. zebrina]
FLLLIASDAAFDVKEVGRRNPSAAAFKRVTKVTTPLPPSSRPPLLLLSPPPPPPPIPVPPAPPLKRYDSPRHYLLVLDRGLNLSDRDQDRERAWKTSS